MDLPYSVVTVAAKSKDSSNYYEVTVSPVHYMLKPCKLLRFNKYKCSYYINGSLLFSTNVSWSRTHRLVQDAAYTSAF